jgi:glutathione peroxidase-family protein
MEGVKVAIFPCNQFGAQEPGSDAEIADFVLAKGVNPAQAVIFSKADVNGPATREAFKAVKDATGMVEISWNFAAQFIVDRDGNISKCENLNQAVDMVREKL